MKFIEGLVWFEVRTPQCAKPLNFLLDTGASVSVLNLSTAQRLGLTLGSAVKVMGVGGTASGHWPVKLLADANHIELPGEYLALDLSRLSRSCGNPVDGLVGADFFRDRVVQIDYAAQQIRVLNARPPVDGVEAVPLEVRRCGFRVSISVNNHRRQWMRLDTGCALGLRWVTKEVAAESCASKMAVGLSELFIPQTVASINLGKQHIDGVPTGLHREEIFPGECGLLGNELLARFNVITIDAKSGRLILGPLPVE